jgi:hypothetical protein
MATAAKDMWVANLVESWRGEQGSVPVHEFFEAIDEAAEMGQLSTKDKLRLSRLKLKGVAREFYTTQPGLKGDEVEYADFKAAFVQRFKDKQTDQYNYTRLQTASQEKNESPEIFLDRLRKLCQRTIQHTENPVEQAVLNRDAEKRLLAAFINGLRGGPGKPVRLQMPNTIDMALNMAITATNAEASERDSERDSRYSKQMVFAVRGNRGSLRGPGNWIPRGKSQEGMYRAGSGFTPTGQYSRGRGAWRGTHSFWTDSRTPARGGVTPDSARTGSQTPAGGGPASGPKNDDDRYTRRDLKSIQCFNCGLYGHVRQGCRMGREGCPGSSRNHPYGIGKTN